MHRLLNYSAIYVQRTIAHLRLCVGTGDVNKINNLLTASVLLPLLMQERDRTFKKKLNLEIR